MLHTAWSTIINRIHQQTMTQYVRYPSCYHQQVVQVPMTRRYHPTRTLNLSDSFQIWRRLKRSWTPVVSVIVQMMMMMIVKRLLHQLCSTNVVTFALQHPTTSKQAITWSEYSMRHMHKTKSSPRINELKSSSEHILLLERSLTGFQIINVASSISWRSTHVYQGKEPLQHTMTLSSIAGTMVYQACLIIPTQDPTSFSLILSCISSKSVPSWKKLPIMSPFFFWSCEKSPFPHNLLPPPYPYLPLKGHIFVTLAANL